MGTLTEILEGAKLIGYNDTPYDYDKLCVWYGGYSFSVYGAGSFNEVDHFTSGELAGMSDLEQEEAYESAADRMKASGFNPVN